MSTHASFYIRFLILILIFFSIGLIFNATVLTKAYDILTNEDGIPIQE